MKITEKNRSLVFLGGTMLIGILIIGVLVYFENNDVESVEIVNQPANTNFKTLESKIKNLKTQNFDPNSYNTMATEINASYEQELLTADQKTNLVLTLSAVYSDLVYSRCDFYLSGMGLDSSKNVSSWLNQLEKITARNARIVKYQNQIKWYDYYSTTLSSKVHNFINPGITNYNDDKYKKLTEEVSRMPNLDPAYKNKSKFIKIKNELIFALQNFNAEFYSVE
ncbi:MAG: hypothetical protein C0412_16050 [Flavobacterium sp.]|nr:hypothetical protein [Flavobacterium sp.]